MSPWKQLNDVIYMYVSYLMACIDARQYDIWQISDSHINNNINDVLCVISLANYQTKNEKYEFRTTYMKHMTCIGS